MRMSLSALLAPVLALGLLVPGTAAQAQTRAHLRGLYVYGHSYTTGAELAHPSQRYTALVARDEHERLHSRGVNGLQAYRIEERLYGTGPSSWAAGTAGDVLIQDNLNTARDYGVNSLALATSRNALRAMVATISASSRIEDTDADYRYRGSWHLRTASWVSGGSMHDARRNGSSVEFRATGGEYVSVRGVSGDGVELRIQDRTAGHTVAHLSTGHRVHPAYSHDGVPLLYRVSPRLAGHTIRITKQSGTGTFWFDGRLPQRPHPGTVLLVEEPHLLDYSRSAHHPNGSDAAIDAFTNGLVTLAKEFPNAETVDLNAAGWDPRTYLADDGVHPTRAGHRFIADVVESVYRPR